MLYSETIPDPRVSAIIRGIGLKERTAFRSALMGDENLTCYKAHRLGGQDTWTVREIVALRHQDRYNISQKTIATSLCFFDALHLCAQKDKTRRAMGLPECNDAALGALSLDNTQHWKIMAQKRAQPVDMTDMPLPAAGGEILVDGLFSEQALAVAAVTHKKPVTTAPAIRPDFSGMFQLPAVSHPVGATALDALRHHTQHALPAFQQTIKPGQKIMTLFEKNVGKGIKLGDTTRWANFEWDGGGGLAVLGLAGIVGGVIAGGIAGGSMMWGTGALQFLCIVAGSVGGGIGGGFTAGYLPGAVPPKFGYAFWKASRAIEKLPDGPEKNLMREFHCAARATYHLERAAVYARKHAKDGYNSKILLKAEKQARKGLALANTPPEDIDRIIASIYEGKYPEPDHFFSILKEKQAALHAALAPKIKIADMAAQP